MKWIQDVIARYKWNRMSEEGPTRSVIKCTLCGWEDNLWADGKSAAVAESEKRIQSHILLAHPDEDDLVGESPTLGIL